MLALVASSLTGGCQWPSFGSGERKPTDWTVSERARDGEPAPTGPANVAERQVRSLSASADPAPASAFAVRVDVWAISVPRGSVSGNEAFWKRVDEDAIDPLRYDLLFKNGFRVGVARQDDWDYFRDILARFPARHQLNALTVTDEQSVEVPVRKDIESQILSYFDADKPVELKSYDKCQNILQLSFLPAPRRTDAARISMTPVVRATRERLEYNPDNSERVLRYVQPERLYELNLAVEVPFGQLLVLSPSTDTARQTSIGRNFLLIDGNTEQSELILLIAPTRVPLKAGTEQPAAPTGLLKPPARDAGK